MINIQVEARLMLRQVVASTLEFRQEACIVAGSCIGKAGKSLGTTGFNVAMAFGGPLLVLMENIENRPYDRRTGLAYALVSAMGKSIDQIMK